MRKRPEYHKITKEIALNKINEKITHLNSEGFNFEFIGIEGEVETHESFKVIIKCNIHKEIKKIIFSSFIKEKSLCGCIKCNHNIGHKSKYNDENIMSFINSKLQELSEAGYHIKFISYENPSGKFRTNDSKITLRCLDHGEVYVRNLYSFLEEGSLFGCNTCSQIKRLSHHIITNQMVYDRINSVKQENINCDHILKIDRDESLGLSSDTTDINLYCDRHGIFTRRLRSLWFTPKTSCQCPLCKREEYWKEDRETALVEIEMEVKRRNEKENRNIEFLGFKEDKFQGKDKTRLLFRCITHNTINEMSYRRFIIEHDGYSCGCEICQYSEKVSKGEKVIKSFLEDLEEVFKVQERIDRDDKDGKLFVDFYLPRLNIFIEFNGEQHYKYVPYFYGNRLYKYEDQLDRDKYLINYCKKNSIELLSIPYVDFKRIDVILWTFLNSGEDLTTKITPKDPSWYK